MKRITIMLALAACNYTTRTDDPPSAITGASGPREPDPYEDHLDLGLGVYEEPPRLDLPPVDPDAGSKCDTLDLLFVIDNSGSMLEEQDRLAAAAPAFIKRMQDYGIANSLHIGVTTTDDRYVPGYPECDALGALVTHVNNPDPDGPPLIECTPYSSGAAYMTERDQLEDDFTCAFRVGRGGSGTEKPIGALIEAIKPALSDGNANPFERRADDCNADFHRPNTGLVVVIITDEDDSTPGDAGLWAEQFDWLHKGPAAFIGILPAPHCEDTLAPTAVRILEFFESYKSYVGSVCTDGYTELLDKAVGAIVEECQAWEPVP